MEDFIIGTVYRHSNSLDIHFFIVLTRKCQLFKLCQQIKNKKAEQSNQRGKKGQAKHT